MTEESAVKVCVRVRPLIAREESAASENAESVQLFWKTDKKSIHQIDDGNSTKTFSFDRVFTAEETTNQLYQDIAKPLVVSTVEGYNGTIFAYGQTSSGKTFTMMGSDHIPGVIPLAVEDVFQTIKNCPKKEFLLRVSYMEIYNETVTDLLVDSWKRKPLEVRETINKNIYVADLTEELVISPAQALAWIRKGEKNRHYGKTKMNQRSSRSHTIFRMILESRERSDVASGENADGAIIVSHLNLVDLAGSERASQTGAEGTRFKEGCNINRSLFTLGQVIKKVTEESQKGFTNYRDSKLTRILQNSLGGNAKTVIICTITPVTLDETLSTLQFASTAKKMKNDPHVTEVSDDGALLKRYRNEIVDLKRRLHEVSSVTQTTVTEKEVLSQLLQEKDSLQREQEDRIKNLTKLLVTSTNQVPVKKMPKRRVTWGGKMLRLATSSACGDSSNLSFAESFTRKRKADRSCLMELTEDDEEFEANWEIPDEPSDDMEISQSSVTVRSFGDSPKDYTSPDWMRDFSGKEEAMTKVESLEGRVAELELQLQTEAQQKQEALEKVDTSEKRAAEMEQQQQSEAQQKLEAKEKVLMLELRVADLERQLEEQRHGLTENEQIRREFADTIQLCETLASEKDMVVAERDYLKQELGMFIEQTERLEKEKAALSQELEEKRETDEFKSLEEEFKKEQELEVQNEISSYKKVIESTEVKCQELQNKVDTLSEEILKKTKSAEQLQRMSGEELVQEVAKLRRSLDDAEGVSRDTKKEWAVLRSQNITLEEIKVTLTSNLEKMEAEVNSLCSQLEIEKSRYRKMESDLQKELTVTFDENTKLTNLLDGKVPKNLIDCVEFERTVATLSEELTASREAEGALRVQLEELASSQTPHKVDNLMKQVCELSEELSAVQSQRESLLSAQAQYQEEAQQLQGLLQISHDERVKIQADLSAAALREQELILHCTDVSQQLNSLHSDRERSDPEIQFEEICLKLEESDQQRALLVEKVNEMQQLIKHLEKKLADSEVSRTSQEEISKELQEQLKQQIQVLQCVQAEKEALLSERKAETPNSAEEMDQLLSTLTSVTAERDQLKMDLQENVEMMIENEEELRTALEKNREQKELLSHLETLQKSEVDGALTEKSAQLEARQKQLEESDQQRALLVEKVNEMQQLIKHLEKKLADSEVSRTSQEEISKELQEQLKQQTQVLQCVQAEKEALLSEQKAETPNSAEEMDQLLSTLTSVTAERDQLKTDLQENVEMMIENQEELRTALEKNREQKELLSHLETLQKSEVDGALIEMSAQLEAQQKQIKSLTEQVENSETSFPSSSEENAKLLCRVTSLCEERDQLQETLQELRQENQQLRAELEDRMETLQCEVKTLTEKLESTETERDSQLCYKEASFQSSSEEKEKLLCRVTSLSEERDQLQETLQELRQENQQLKAELEDRMENLQCEVKTLTEKLESTETERDSLLCDKEASFQSSSEEKEKLLCRVTSLSEERDQLQETLQELRQENQQLRAELEDRMKNLQCEVKTLTENLESTETERDSLLCYKEASFQSSSEEKEKLLCRVTSLSEERDQLQETLQELRQENQQLKAELEDRMENLQCEVKTLTEKLESTETERDSLLCDKEASYQSSSEEKEKLLCRVTSLCEEKDKLQETLQELRQENQQLKAELEDRMENLQCEVNTLTEKLESTETERDSLLCYKEASFQSSSEEKEKLLCRVTSLCEERDQLQETLQELRQENQQLKAELEDRMENLQCEVNTLTEKLESTETERDTLLCYKEASFQSSSEEKEKLLCRVTSLSEERDQLQETLQELRQENQQLKAELEDRMENLQCEVKTLTEKLESTETERDSLLSHKEASFQSSSEEKEKLLCRVMSLCEERDQLQETLQELRKENQQLRAELEDRMENLQCELLRADRGSTGVEVTVSSRLNDSTRQLQETFRGFEHFIDKCSKYISIPMDKVLRVQSGLNHGYLTSLPKSTMSAYTAICQLGLDTVQTLGNIVVCLQVKAQDFRNRFEELVKKDLSVFEERRLQDVLLCRVQAPSFSVKDEDFHTVWEHRLTELLDKRELYQQKMSIILEKFLDNVASHPNELSAEITLRERFKEQLQGTISTQPISFGELDSILSCELDRRAALAHSKKMILQDITAEQSVLSEELKLLEAQACFQLREEKSKSSTLLQAIEGAPLKTELSLLKDNQNLLIQLKHTEEKVKALHVQNEQLEEAQIQAKDMLSSHKQATQLLQTELQDSRAQHDEKEMTIKTLRGKLQECEKRASPSAVELENLQTKLFKMEVELSSASDKHQQEIQKMSTVLAVKEESLRNLKETLRRLQQQGEESFLQGEDLHTKLTNTRGLVIKSSILLDKAKLEEEVKQLYLKITELECLVSTQQTEISKWKSRAISLKVKSKVEVDKPSSPCTTAKRGPQETADSSFLSSPKKFVVTSRKILDSPRKVMDFPKVYQLHSPKSRLFDVGGSSDLLSRTYPKQFFDNSSLGTIPEVSHVPDTPDAERDAAAGVDAARKDEWWPQSPKQEDMCKTQ
ncbi:centromere-associated protein E isoform X5 [Paralichthys olivaceus]|uniref:centromere-associated protein E isoform X5 n=1 Tax=Paralichthys olivaceus TaxID=8255 RepID=UPI00375320E2